MEKRNPAKKRNFSDVEIETLTSQVQSNQLVLFGSLKSGVKGISPNTAILKNKSIVRPPRPPCLVWIVWHHKLFARLLSDNFCD